MFCTNCGSQQKDGAKFCTACGAPLAQAPSVEAALPVERAPARGSQPAGAPSSPRSCSRWSRWRPSSASPRS